MGRRCNELGELVDSNDAVASNFAETETKRLAERIAAHGLSPQDVHALLTAAIRSGLEAAYRAGCVHQLQLDLAAVRRASTQPEAIEALTRDEAHVVTK